MLILIPAYKPDQSLITLAQKLDASARQQGVRASLLVVNDGSGPAYKPIFRQLEELGDRLAPAPSLEGSLETPGLASISILHLPANTGKGAALRAGLAWAQEKAPGQVVVTADADSQHLPADILAVGQETQEQARAGQRALVLGVRTLTDPAAPATTVPLRSRVGNSLTAFLFGLSTGQKLADTQTGLRGLTPQILPWALSLPGDRYEYEFTMLLRASRQGVALAQVPITKVYEPGNPSSHFRPLADSARIYAPLLAFVASSFSGFMIDTLALLLLVALGAPLLLAVVLARVISALANFALNRFIMKDGSPRPSAPVSLARYASLALALLATNALAIQGLTFLGMPLLAAKILVELALIPVSFSAQKRWVFAKRPPAAPVPLQVEQAKAKGPLPSERSPLASVAH